jgi:hypothetical protein
MLDPKITEDVVDSWNTLQKDARKGFDVQRALLPKNVMQQIIDALFLATLRVEEGQYPHFSVIVLPRNPTSPSDADVLKSVMRLGKIELLTAARLAKFSGAFDPDFSAIAVDWDESVAGVVIWGVVPHMPPIRPLEEPLGQVMPVQLPPPDFLRIMSAGPATLRFVRRYFAMGTLQDGVFQKSLPTPFTKRSLGGLVTRLLNIDVPKEGLIYDNVVLAGFQQLLHQMAIRGHGGTLVVVPGSKKKDTLPLDVRNSFVTGELSIGRTLVGFATGDISPINTAILYQRAANEELKRLAQLSTIDGALVISEQFEVIAFGALLNARDSSLECVEGPDGMGNQTFKPFDVNRYGSRHRSAFNFAAACEGSVVFVVSQDGPVRAFARAQNDQMNVWPDCNVRTSV